MNYRVEEIDFSTKLEELGLVLPSKLGFFPENIDDVVRSSDFIFTESMLDLKKIFRQESIDVLPLGDDTELYRCRKSADIYMPALFFSLSSLIENPTVVSVSLNILSNYIYDFCKGSLSKKNTQIDFYFETKDKGKLKKLSYRGNVEGLKELEKIIIALR